MEAEIFVQADESIQSSIHLEERKILASESGFDGFYMALLERKNK